MQPSSILPIELWRSVAILESAPEAAVEALARVAMPVTRAAGEIIFLEGDPTAGIFLVEEGTVKICRFSKEGREYTLHLEHRGDTFNDVSALDGGPNPATAIAFTDVKLWRIAREDLRRVTGLHPELTWSLVESLARRARYLVGVVQDLAMRDVRGRLARLLLEQATAAERGDQPDPLTQEEMANRIGTVREVVGRTLRAMAADGLISMDRQRIVIVDRKGLESEADK